MKTDSGGMKTDRGRLTHPAPGHCRHPNLRLADPARRRLILRSPALSAGHLMTPSISLDNRFLTSSGICRTSSTLPLHFSQSLSPRLPRTLSPLTSPHLTPYPLTAPPPKNKADEPFRSAESEGQPDAPISTRQWVVEDPTEASMLMPSYNLSAQQYEDLDQARGALVAEELRDVLQSSQNQQVKLREKKEALLHGVCCSLIKGANFTVTNDVTRVHLLELCQEIANQEPEFVLKVALYTRQELNIRSTANFLLAASAWLPPCRPHLRRYFCKAVRLPSDWIEVAKMYQSLAESSRKVAPYPSCLRQALTDSFKLFDEYQLAKYNSRKQRCKSSLRRRSKIQELPSDSNITKWSDYLSIAKRDTAHHVAKPSPALKEDKPKVIDQFSLKKLIRWLHLKEPAYHIMCLLGRRYPSDLQSFARSRLPGPWDSRRAGKRMKLQVPETWERQLSLHGNTVKGWEELIDHQKLPFMAMLRNLRNMIAAGLSSRHHEQNLKRLTDRNSVIHSRQFPFRFFSAHKVFAELQKRLEQKDDPLPTKQALVQEALGSIRLPKGSSRFLKAKGRSPARQNRVECISFIYRRVIKKLAELEKRRDVRYDQDLLEKYQAALDTAIEISATHNVPPLPGRTVILCSVENVMNNPCYSAKGLCVPRDGTQDSEGEAKGPTMLEVAVLLGLMVKHVSEHCQLVLCSCGTYREVDIGPESILGNVGQVLQKAKELQEAAMSGSVQHNCIISFLLDSVQDNVQIDTILSLGYGNGYTFSEALQFYRYHVNLDLLHVDVNLYLSQASVQPEGTGCKNDVHLSGYSDQILRFMCERGSSRLLEHVDRIDDIFHLPRASQSGQRRRAVEPTAVSPLLQTPKLRWRTVRVFVSSTFRDMRGERDLLTRSVFPELRARAARHFVRVQEVDLRWGITEEESRGNRQLEICLSEVTRCELFVGILGERYGQILQEYSLPNLPQFEWVKSYPQGRSITELEMMQFLRQNGDCSSQTSFFYTRDAAVLRSLPERWRSDFAAESEEGKTRVADLKSHVKEAGLLALENYQSEWGGEVDGRPYLKGLEEFGASVLTGLWKAIVSQHCQAERDPATGSAADDEDALQDGFLEAQSWQRYGRVKQLAAAASAIRERRKGGAFVVYGKPSEGKTAFMASLVTQLSPSDKEKCPGPSDLLFHFTAASERAQDGTSMLHRLCVLLNARLKGQQEVPLSYRGLVLEFHSLLDRVAGSQPRRHLVLIIDGADCVQTERGLRTSDWIPEHLPRGVTLVLSVTEDSSLHRALAKRKGTVAICLGPLEPLDRSEVVRRSLAVYGKKLEESAFNNQMRLLVMKKESHNPLFLKLASEELREFGVFEQISEQIRGLPSTLRLLIQHVLGCLEEQHGAEMVTFALSALSTSGKGLRERDLYSVLCTSGGLRAGSVPAKWEDVMQETLKPSMPVPMATFARLLRNLRCIMGVWAPTETPNSRLRLSNSLLRAAVQLRYLRDDSREKQVHLYLAAHLWRLTDPEGKETFTDCDPEALADLPEHLILSEELPRLASLLTNLRFSSLHVKLGLLPQLASTFALYHAAALEDGESHGSLPEVGPYRDFISANWPALSQNPSLFWQQALNQPDSSPVRRQARRLLGEDGRLPLPSKEVPDGFRLVEWTNKPQELGGPEGKVMTIPTEPLCVSIAPAGRTAVVGTSGGYLHILDLDSGQEMRSLASGCDGISDCVFVGENALCATSFDGKIEVWSLVDGCRLLLIDGHRDRITGCALSPDGKHLATCSWDRTVKVWVVATGKLNVALANPHPLNCVTFHPEGQLLATGSWDRTVRIWNWVRASVVSVLQGHPASVRAVTYAPSGDYLASASLLGDVRLWSAASGLEAGGYLAHQGPVTTLRFIADGRYLLTTGEDHQVRIWSGTLGRALREYSADEPSAALCVSVSKNGTLMAVGYHSNQVKIFHLETGALAAECDVLRVPMRCLQWLDGEEFLASGSDDNIVRVWQLRGSRARCARRCRGHTRPPVSLSHSEQFLASASDDFTILLWTLAELIDREGCVEVSPACVLRRHSDSVTCCSFSPNGLQLVTGSKDKSLLFWDLTTLPGRVSRSLLACHRDWITDCTWAPRYVASCSNDGMVRLWEPDSGECIRELKGHTSAVSGVCIMADLVLSVSGSGELLVWKESGAAVTTIRAHHRRINHLAVFNKPGSAVQAEREQGALPERLIVATASDDGSVKLWHPLLADEVSTLTGHSAPVSGAATGNCIPFFLTVGADRTVRLWDVPDRKGVEHPSRHQGAVTALCWSPSGAFLVSGSRSGEVKVWSSGIVSHSIQAHMNCISTIVFISENNFAVGSYDKSVSIWTLRPRRQTHSVWMCLQSSFTLDWPIYCLSMLRMQERLLVGDLKGNLFFCTPEGRHWTVLASSYWYDLYSRVIERNDGSLLMVKGPQRTTLMPLEKYDNLSTVVKALSHVDDFDNSCWTCVTTGDTEEAEQDTESEEEQKNDTAQEEDQDTESEEEQENDTAQEEDQDTAREEQENDTAREEDQDMAREEQEKDTAQEEQEKDTAQEEQKDTAQEEQDTAREEETKPHKETEMLRRGSSNIVCINPWGLDRKERVDTLLWLTVVKESGTTPGGARSMLCADSRGTLWCSDWDPTAIPTEEINDRHDHKLSTWTRKQVHSERVTAVTETNDLIVTSSYDQTVRLWDRRSLKQVGLFTCQAPVLCLEANPVSPGVGVCGDSSGNVYFLRWNSRPADG